MKKNKKKGFSLLEVCIAVALVGIMIGITGPKVRRYLATAKNTKAISTLQAVRTASQIYNSETGDKTGTEGQSVSNAVDKLKPYLDEKLIKQIKKGGKIEIGGGVHVDEEKELDNKDLAEKKPYYGGTVTLKFDEDGVNVIMGLDDANKNADFKGNKWKQY